jgi:hypothetical protein
VCVCVCVCVCLCVCVSRPALKTTLSLSLSHFVVSAFGACHLHLQTCARRLGWAKAQEPYVSALYVFEGAGALYVCFMCLA